MLPKRARQREINGARGAAAGLSEQILLRAAGATQTLAGTSDKDFGAWWAGTPYGDDPVDQIWIKAGRRQKL
ncbi:hypothetical protein C3L32_33860, partial [Pseudomonas aeruginosa]